MTLTPFFDPFFGAGIIWEDDGQIEELRLRKGYDKADPHVDLTITRQSS